MYTFCGICGEGTSTRISLEAVLSVPFARTAFGHLKVWTVGLVAVDGPELCVTKTGMRRLSTNSKPEGRNPSLTAALRIPTWLA